MRRHRNAKIVATLGPSSADAETIRRLFDAGADVFRLNFSHGSHEDHRERVFQIRKLEREVERPIGILLDLQGPKLRVGTFGDGAVELERGSTFRFDLEEDEGSVLRAPLPHPEIFAALSPGDCLLVDDGKVRMEVQDCGPDFAETLVLAGGRVSDRKGVNVPSVILPLSPLTEKDKEDLEFGLDLGIDWVALSFVQRPQDLELARSLIDGRAALLTKVEKPSAMDCIGELVELSDAVMVARGDLGVEMPPEAVPRAQKEIIRACRLAGRPVIVATQMLESMIGNPAPTRAEASDVATAIYDGADAVMLSAESAAGSYPVESVTIMSRIIESTERDPSFARFVHALQTPMEGTSADAISHAASEIAMTLGAAAIACYTMSGSTALRAARERPSVPILAFSNKMETARQLALLWGTHCVHTADVRNTTEMVDKATRIAREEGFAEPGRELVITAGMPFGSAGRTNVLRIAAIQS